ncbi:hypothetical protein GCK72_017892 [Caenorhabditis remanei]|uniref:Glycosyltransferase family 92 protein n=1 Tax=Caenorhabditis remanei TaxID=31234 RepID=A0A6A5G8C0_CAERE|nr:hypothetical protein GCK72_017892 [Caenorhabditis remanei]KAF1751338.1 hypothetical protein GCK72_017892 [Caenorhabditis remanei]
MRKLSVPYISALILTPLIIISLLWLLLIHSHQRDEIQVSLKAKKYYQEVMRSRAEEKNIALLSAFDFEDGFITSATSKVLLKGSSVYCHYFDKNRRSIPDSSRQISMFTETIARCPKPENSDSRFISLSYSFRKSPQLVPIPVQKRQFFETKHDLTVCVELELEPNWLEITAFIEYHQNLNIKFFHFTTIDLDAYTRRILDDYIRLGVVKLTSLRSFRNLTTVTDDYKTIQRTNCLLQSRSDSKLVTFLRINERVVDIPFFLQNLKGDDVTETRVVTKTLEMDSTLKRYKNETETRDILGSFSYKRHVQFRKVTDPKNIQSMDQISEDFVYKKASIFTPSIPESVTSSVLFRVKYNYDTRPIYCDEFDIEVLSWCPVNVYHCQFRDETSKKIILEKREEARKVRYKQETIRW